MHENQAVKEETPQNKSTEHHTILRLQKRGGSNKKRQSRKMDNLPNIKFHSSQSVCTHSPWCEDGEVCRCDKYAKFEEEENKNTAQD